MSSVGPLLTTREVARVLCVHPKQVYRLLRRGLPALRVGDEWRFDREQVLRWAGEAQGESSPPPPATPAKVVPGLLAANGDRALEVLLARLRSKSAPLLGVVQADHAGAAELLAAEQVLMAGQHAGEAKGVPSSPRMARLHLVTREIGLVLRAGLRVRSLGGLVGKRLASRPPTAGVRRRFDRELATAGIDPGSAYRHATEHDSHRDVAFAVLAGNADAGLTTQAWARAARLGFLPLGSESYEIVIPATQLNDARALAVCEAAQDREVRRRLRDDFGYDVRHTGELRIDPA